MGLRRGRNDLKGHIELGQGIDFVRGIAREGERRKAEAHLSGSCRRCRKRIEFLRRVLATARTEASEAVPRDLEAAAKTLFLLLRPEKIGLLPRLAGALVFSSRLEPALVGLRGPRQFSHQALYEAGNYALDLRLDQDPARHRVLLVGQIADRRTPGRRFGNTPVMVLTNRKVVAQAHSNRFGEFQVEYEPTGRPHLCLAVTEGRIDLPLHGLGPSTPGARGPLDPEGSKKRRSNRSRAR